MGLADEGREAMTLIIKCMCRMWVPPASSEAQPFTLSSPFMFSFRMLSFTSSSLGQPLPDLLSL